MSHAADWGLLSENLRDRCLRYTKIEYISKSALSITLVIFARQALVNFILLLNPDVSISTHYLRSVCNSANAYWYLDHDLVTKWNFKNQNGQNKASSETISFLNQYLWSFFFKLSLKDAIWSFCHVRNIMVIPRSLFIMDCLLTDLEANWWIYELRSYGGEQSKTVSFWQSFRWTLSWNDPWNKLPFVKYAEW